jgi:transposase
MKRPIEQRREVLRSLLSGEINSSQAQNLLGCSRRSIERYRKGFLTRGLEGLKDHRHSNHYKLTQEQKEKIVGLKQKDRWRSARNIRDRLNLSVHAEQVRRILADQGLMKENVTRVKPIERFEAAYPNELWQCDIMGRIEFPQVGRLYLIATVDDHSRFCLSGKWFKTQGKMNAFQVWYEALARFGVPRKMLQDAGSQYKARTRFGTADYQWYAEGVHIQLLWARRAQTKGKIERFWKFVQGDFVREVWNVRSVEEINGAFRVWLARYNYRFTGDSLNGSTHASRYKPSERRLSRVELETLLVVEERRKVSRESTISLYGNKYVVPPGYINCRIWVKVIGNKVIFEANGEVFWKTKLKV